MAEREEATPRGRSDRERGGCRGAESGVLITAFSDKPRESERKNKPCVCVRKELPGEFLKPL